MGVKRKTKSVLTVLDLFEKSDTAFSGVDLIAKFKDQMNKTTVYRILDRLKDEGFLHSFTDNDGLKWYAKCLGCSHDKHSDLHPHFQCQDCGKTECISLDLDIPKVSKHKVEYAELLLVGRCEECLA